MDDPTAAPDVPDLLVTGGHLLVDGQPRRRDVLLRAGRVHALVEPARDGSTARPTGTSPGGTPARVVDATGALVLPGLVDLHTHAYWGGNRLGVNADKNAATSGVTTWVDAGTAGATNMEGFYHHVVRGARVRILPLLNMSYVGIAPAGMMTNEIGELFEPRHADLAAVLRVEQELPGLVHGIKVRASANTIADNAPVVLPLARAAADELQVPLMVHVGMAPPVIDEVLPYLRAGDILTHCFHPHAGGRVVDGRGRVLPAVREAVARGVLLDVGHGVASIGYDVARACLDQGFAPATISTDLHSENIDGPVRNLLRVMSEFLALGLDVPEVTARVTTAPAAAVRREDLGALHEGGVGDLAVVRVVDHHETYQDTLGSRLAGERVFEHVATIVGGRLLEPFDDGRREGRTSPWQTRFGADAAS